MTRHDCAVPGVILLVMLLGVVFGVVTSCGEEIDRWEYFYCETDRDCRWDGNPWRTCYVAAHVCAECDPARPWECGAGRECVGSPFGHNPIGFGTCVARWSPSFDTGGAP